MSNGKGTCCNACLRTGGSCSDAAGGGPGAVGAAPAMHPYHSPCPVGWSQHMLWDNGRWWPMCLPDKAATSVRKPGVSGAGSSPIECLNAFPADGPYGAPRMTGSWGPNVPKDPSCTLGALGACCAACANGSACTCRGYMGQPVDPAKQGCGGSAMGSCCELCGMSGGTCGHVKGQAAFAGIGPLPEPGSIGRLGATQTTNVNSSTTNWLPWTLAGLGIVAGAFIIMENGRPRLAPARPGPAPRLESETKAPPILPATVKTKGLADARTWLRDNPNQHPFASNTLSRSSAISFVDQLYREGASKVQISGILGERDRLISEGGPYADTLIVTASKQNVSRLIAFLNGLKESKHGFAGWPDEIQKIGQNRIRLWWD